MNHIGAHVPRQHFLLCETPVIETAALAGVALDLRLSNTVKSTSKHQQINTLKVQIHQHINKSRPRKALNSLSHQIRLCIPAWPSTCARSNAPSGR